MLLEHCSTVSQGAFLSRVHTHLSTDTVKLSVYTMKEMNESLGIEYHGSMEKLQEVHVLKGKERELPITKEGMVLVNLTAHRAVSVRREHIGRLIPSNFAIIEPKESLEASYLEWYLNDHPECRKQLRIATQGTTVAALSIQMLRSLKIELPMMEKQQIIGDMKYLKDQKKRLVNERLQLEEILVKYLSLGYLKEVTK
ncbi:hypothetical protein CBR59_25615 [Bacillus thuringiensis]|uniref:restriction endonuclease subunit S n=1 Tax=Bacillus thuringiensis TaxID=1428 RepID=UPI000C9E7F11|nr:restriction endonuclease subunit S [Bacillus thuringiensis]MDA2273465.1 restriction endonuclease subunit S [Bacillus cereus]PNK24275.1 hypothetical protein CBP87_26830 [Bacillus thuringiensis]PNK50928.1 hypothetical protein CBR59_25615 [Bacillus thuringiensis]